MRSILALAVVAISIGLGAYWIGAESEYRWSLPENYPKPVVPQDNPMSESKVELGRWLFYDVRLSGNQSMSCASCHIQQLAFTDAKPRSLGSTGELHPRSAMSLVNSAFASRLTWANPLLDRLEDQALTPLLGDNPVELGMGGHESRIAALLERDPNYRRLSQRAFPEDENPYSLINSVRAIAAFVRSIVSYNAPYDRYLAGDSNAISAQAERGMALFFSERVECFHCHGGINFTDSSTHATATVVNIGFHNNGLYNLQGSGAYPADNTGLFDMTGEPRDMGRFKAPSLRNIGVTAPYMHDGSVASLVEVIDHYARGGRMITDGENAGDGRLSPFKSEFVTGFELSDAEREELLAFLLTLTDVSVLNDTRWADPFVQ